MPAEHNVTSPPVQFIRLNNIAWMNCKLKIMHGWDASKNAYTKETPWKPEIMKDQESRYDLSTIEGITVGDTIRPYVDAVRAHWAKRSNMPRTTRRRHSYSKGHFSEAGS